MTEYGKFDYESYQDLQTIQNFLASLRDGFKNGKIILSSGSDEMILQPKDLLNFKLKAKKKASNSKLEIEISWKEGIIGSPKGKLKIGSSTND